MITSITIVHDGIWYSLYDNRDAKRIGRARSLEMALSLLRIALRGVRI